VVALLEYDKEEVEDIVVLRVLFEVAVGRVDEDME